MSSSNRPFTTVRTLVYLQLVGVVVLSFHNLVEVGLAFGLGWEAWTLPLLIDAFALLGMVGRGKAFSPKSRKAGFRLMVGAGMVSLVCNVEAGHNIGQRIFGVLVVAGAITAEWYASRLTPRRVVKARTPRSAPVSPGMPPVHAEPAEVLAYREAAKELRRTSSLAGMNNR